MVMKSEPPAAVTSVSPAAWACVMMTPPVRISFSAVVANPELTPEMLPPLTTIVSSALASDQVPDTVLLPTVTVVAFADAPLISVPPASTVRLLAPPPESE